MELKDQLVNMMEMDDMLASICNIVGSAYGLTEEEILELVEGVHKDYTESVKDMMYDIFTQHLGEEGLQSYIGMQSKVAPASDDFSDAIYALIEGAVFKIRGIEEHLN